MPDLDRPLFADRVDAGRRLAGVLDRFRGREDALVLALPRGGVPVGYEVARGLGLPLDVVVVRKLGMPGQPELALGAIGPGGIRVLNESLVSEGAVDAEVIERIVEREAEELERRERAYRADRPPLDVRDRTVLLVDDGIATGATARAAVLALRALGATRIVVAVPVGAPDVVRRLASEADDVVCPYRPEPLWAIGLAYEKFGQVSDDEVRELLARSRAD